MSLQDILTIFALIGGIATFFELLEYLFTKRIPWLFRLVRDAGRWLWRRLGWRKVKPGQRFLVLNFSAHPIMPGQQQAIKAKMGWPSLEVIDTGLGNIKEDRNFTAEVIKYIEGIDLLPREWQTIPLAVVPAGYAPAWSILLAELHGRLGYFPAMVRLRPTAAGAAEKYEVAEIVPLREIRNRARAKRHPAVVSQGLAPKENIDEEASRQNRQS